VQDKEEAEGNWISFGKVMKRISLSIIFIEGVKEMVEVVKPPF